VIWSIAFNSSGDVLCGDGGGFFVGPGSVYRSSDNGNNWSQTSITNRSVIAIIATSISTIYAGTDNGIYVSYDNGQTGEQINSGLTESTVHSLCLDKNGYLFAGTPDGIFRSVQSVTTCIEEMERLPSNFLLNQNHPNPFNPSTKISYSIPERSNVSLKVFDLLGSEVSELFNGEIEAGSYEINFDALLLPSGVYFYQLKAGDYRETKKMILLR
jgi:hypothetical protein